ncbi:MAG: hypothetical protein PUC88_07445 [Clostridia bacterium]|nr:hypothetical protein [Clostridia bacterium]
MRVTTANATDAHRFDKSNCLFQQISIVYIVSGFSIYNQYADDRNTLEDTII